jgi:hypothetical protein
MPFQLLHGTRAARRVVLANTSPEPQAGLRFNQTLTNQSFSFPNPALTAACLVFWAKRNRPYSPSTEYWFVGLRPANLVYVALDGNANGGFYVEGQARGSSTEGLPAGIWNRVVVNLDALQAGSVNIFAGGPSNGAGPLDIEIYDVRFYARKFSAAEIANRVAAPTDSLLAQFELAPNTPGPLVIDQSGNGRNGTLYNF